VVVDIKEVIVCMGDRLCALLEARVALLLIIWVWTLGWPLPAFAYRPFDGTDAAVADPGELEIELQPAGGLREGSQTTLVAPDTVFNYGFAKDWEAVLEGQVQTPLSPSGPISLTATGAFLKHVLRSGSLQDQAGPSIATEFGVLLPEINADSRFGAHWAGIVSERWDWGTIHLNVATDLTRDHQADLFLDAIIEGPSKWSVRPVAEVFFENEFNQSQTVSGLVGLIWQVNDKLALDVAFRKALTGSQPVCEFRAGMTFGFALDQLGGMKSVEARKAR
jgi:hypothetical protein